MKSPIVRSTKSCVAGDAISKIQWFLILAGKQPVAGSSITTPNILPTHSFSFHSSGIYITLEEFLPSSQSAYILPCYELLSSILVLLFS